MKKQNLIYLVKRFQEKTITEQELEVLKDYVQKHGEPDELLNQVFDELAMIARSSKSPSSESSERILTNIFQKVDFTGENQEVYRKKYLKYWTTAAAILFIVGIFVYSQVYITSDEASSQIVSNHLIDSIKPGKAKATLLLEDGTSIDLENFSSDSILQFGDYAVFKNKEGQLSYILPDSLLSRPIFNTIVTPKGGEYELNLPDGSHIWVNASSKIKYPINFAEYSREIELEGEAYFDVKNISRGMETLPFIVYSGNQKLEVLGTVFNVNSYGHIIQTTLVEGLVKLSYDGLDSYYLKPSQQAYYSTEDNTVHIESVDPFYTTAWKNNKFAFEDASIFEVMETISRWYDVEVEYEGDLSSVSFSGTISRYEDFTKMLNIIEWTGPIKFNIQGRRVLVMK